MTNNDGGPVYPVTGYNNLGQPVPQSTGISLRDYMACAALQGLLAGRKRAVDDCWSNDKALTSHSYRIADAMIAEREREG